MPIADVQLPISECHFLQKQIGNRQSTIDNARIPPPESHEGSKSMPERRGVQATEEIKAEWSHAYKIYLKAPGDRYDKKKDRTSRIDFVAQEMKLTRKQAKRRIRNYEAWQRNIKKGIAT